MTIGALPALRMHGRSVPDDLALCCFAAFSWADLFLPPRNAVDQHRHSFPTRRSSDLPPAARERRGAPARRSAGERRARRRGRRRHGRSRDRKSTRLNSSHVEISYAVFCLKRKTRPGRGAHRPRDRRQGDDHRRPACPAHARSLGAGRPRPVLLRRLLLGRPVLAPTQRRRPAPPLFPYTTLFRSPACRSRATGRARSPICWRTACAATRTSTAWPLSRSEEHTSELQSRRDLVCRLLLEKKNSPWPRRPPPS